MARERRREAPAALLAGGASAAAIGPETGAPARDERAAPPALVTGMPSFDEVYAAHAGYVAGLGLEYLVLTDALQQTLAGADDFVQQIILGVRWPISPRATMGPHGQVTLDRGANFQSSGVLSLARRL